MLLLVIEGACPSMTWAAESPKAGTLSVVLENDMFYGIDRHYTNGLMLTWVPGRDAPTPGWVMTLARLMPWIPEQGVIRHGYTLGQSMFTPGDITLADPPLRERPYAGWLYGTIGLGVESGRRLDQFGMTFGMVGPASLAGQTQKFVHMVFPGNELGDLQLGFVLDWSDMRLSYTHVLRTREFQTQGSEDNLRIRHRRFSGRNEDRMVS
jgi:hypothetical protein